MNDRRRSEIRERADAVLDDLGLRSFPIDPFEVAVAEGIDLAPGAFRDGFDGCIRYLPPIDRFRLSYRRPGPGRPPGRVRFTVAHELGHFYLHRDLLTAGRSHGSVTNFESTDPREREADWFAVNLLMPFAPFCKLVRETPGGLDAGGLLSLAADLHVSVAAAARRYCEVGLEPMTVVFSRDGVVSWSSASYDMVRAGLGFVRRGGPLPAGGVSAAAWAADADRCGVANPHAWFDRPLSDAPDLEEDVRPLGGGWVLTCLTPDGNLRPDDGD